jgi:hypothetical protein
MSKLAICRDPPSRTTLKPFRINDFAVAHRLPSSHLVILRIEDVSSESETELTLSGRITSQDVQQLKARIAEVRGPVALDLQQVRLVDLDAVRFLAAAERRGIELRHVPPFVRAWILLERRRLNDLE